MARLVDSEIKALVDEARERCRTLLTENIEVLHAIAQALLERETISGDDIDKLMKGEPLSPFNMDDSTGEFRLEEEKPEVVGDAPAAPAGADVPAEEEKAPEAPAPEEETPSRSAEGKEEK